MNENQIKIVASTGFFVGGIFGMVGSFVSSAPLRGLAWGLDGVSLIVASVLLTVYYIRKGYDVLAAGFFIFAIGEGLILSCSGIDIDKNVSTFGAGVGLWAASLVLISTQKMFPIVVRCIGAKAAILSTIVSVLVFTGYPINPLTKPLPFYAYPFVAASMFGWGWALLKNSSHSSNLGTKTATVFQSANVREPSMHKVV